jgi:hypothetical protein
MCALASSLQEGGLALAALVAYTGLDETAGRAQFHFDPESRLQSSSAPVPVGSFVEATVTRPEKQTGEVSP